MATASIWTPSVGSFYSTQDGPYHDSQYTRSAANTAESSLPETSFTEVFKQMGELWEAYMSNNTRSTSLSDMRAYDSAGSVPYTSTGTQATYGPILSQPSTSVSLDDTAQSALLSAASSLSGQIAIKRANEHVVASVRNLSLSQTDLRKHCEEYLNAVPAEAHLVPADIISHDGFWSFILKNRTGIGRIEAPPELVSRDVVESLTSSAWTYLHQDQSGENAELNSPASSSILPETAAVPFSEHMTGFPSSDAMANDGRQDDPFEMEHAPDAFDSLDEVVDDPLVD